MAISSYRDLRVWQDGMDLVEQVYCLSRSFPRDELYALTSQIRRAAVSIPANIAEVHSRSYTRDYLRHLAIAQASLAEVQTELEIAGRLHYISDEALVDILGLTSRLAKQIHALRSALDQAD